MRLSHGFPSWLKYWALFGTCGCSKIRWELHVRPDSRSNASDLRTSYWPQTRVSIVSSIVYPWHFGLTNTPGASTIEFPHDTPAIMPAEAPLYETGPCFSSPVGCGGTGACGVPGVGAIKTQMQAIITRQACWAFTGPGAAQGCLDVLVNTCKRCKGCKSRKQSRRLTREAHPYPLSSPKNARQLPTLSMNCAEPSA